MTSPGQLRGTACRFPPILSLPVSFLPSSPSSGGECKCKHRVCTVRPLRQNRECVSWHLNFAKIGTRCTESKFSWLYPSFAGHCEDNLLSLWCACVRLCVCVFVCVTTCVPVCSPSFLHFNPPYPQCSHTTYFRGALHGVSCPSLSPSDTSLQQHTSHSTQLSRSFL